MATTKPRITITLSAHQYDVFKSISDNSGQPMSTFITELLELSMPTVERMAETFRKIKLAQDDQRKRMLAELDVAQSAVEPVVAQVVGQFDLFMSRVEAAAGVESSAERNDAATPPLADPLTPVTNRGVTPSPLKARKPSQHKALQPPKVKKVSRKSSKPEGA